MEQFESFTDYQLISIMREYHEVGTFPDDHIVRQLCEQLFPDSQFLVAVVSLMSLVGYELAIRLQSYIDYYG